MTPRIPDTHYDIFNPPPMSTESAESPEIYIYESFEDPNAHRFAPVVRLSSYRVSARLHEISRNLENIYDEAIVDCPSNAPNFIYPKSIDYGYGSIFNRDVAFALIFFLCGCVAITFAFIQTEAWRIPESSNGAKAPKMQAVLSKYAHIIIRDGGPIGVGSLEIVYFGSWTNR